MKTGTKVRIKPWEEILKTCVRAENELDYRHKEINLLIIKPQWKEDYGKVYTILEQDTDGTYCFVEPANNYYHLDWLEKV